MVQTLKPSHGKATSQFIPTAGPKTGMGRFASGRIIHPKICAHHKELNSRADPVLLVFRITLQGDLWHKESSKSES